MCKWIFKLINSCYLIITHPCRSPSDKPLKGLSPSPLQNLIFSIVPRQFSLTFRLVISTRDIDSTQHETCLLTLRCEYLCEICFVPFLFLENLIVVIDSCVPLILCLCTSLFFLKFEYWLLVETCMLLHPYIADWASIHKSTGNFAVHQMKVYQYTSTSL